MLSPQTGAYPGSGQHWTTLSYNDGGAGFTDPGFTTTSQAVVVHGHTPFGANDASSSELLMSPDAGASWHPVDF